MNSSPIRGSARSAPLGVSLLACLLSLGGALPARSSGFAIGDLYLLSNSIPKGAIAGRGILRVDVLTGASSLFLDLPSSPGLRGTLTYDARRDRLLYCTSTATSGLFAVDSAGVTAALLSPSAPTPALVAARGDGKVYFWYPSPEGFSFMDAAGAVSDLLDVPGTARFGLGVGRVLQEMIYHPATNSLVCVTGSVGPAASPCADGSLVCVVRIPLDLSGTRVAGPVTSSQFDVSTSGETVVGAGMGHGSGVLVTVDTNSNDQEPRMLLVDASTLAVSAFASNGSYTGAAGTNAGTYSHRTGRAIILDTLADSLRTFGPGETGRGVAMAPGVSTAFSSGELARLIEIDSSGVALTAVPRVTGGGTGVRFAPPSPNPFRGETMLRWAQPAPAHVTLTVIDISGRRVRTLVDGGTSLAGEHAATWDGRTDAGRTAAPGLYHAVLTVGGRREVRPIVRLR